MAPEGSKASKPANGTKASEVLYINRNSSALKSRKATSVKGIP
jgi:hypothetical protein